MRNFKIITMLIVFLSLTINAQALLDKQKRAPFAFEDRIEAEKVVDYFNQNFPILLQKVRNGEVQKDNESKTAFFKILNGSFKNAGYSMDATFRTIIIQRGDEFWRLGFRQSGYADLLLPLFNGMAKPEERELLIKSGIIKPKTVAAWEEYSVWAADVEKNKE